MTVSPVTPSPAAAPSGVRDAIAEAARRTGVDFSYLVATAKRESGFDANARAATSSAAGLFQFIEQTWLGMVKNHGGAHGLQHLADRIEHGADGRFRVADAGERQAILDLRYDPPVASAMAGEYAAESARALSARLGREPDAGELYAAHFLGTAGAARLIEAAEADPSARADALFPAAARANRSIFFKDGAPATVGQVLANLGAKHAGAARAGQSAPLAAQGIDYVEAAQSILFSGEGDSLGDDSGQGGRAAAWAPPRGGARVLSPLVIEALAALGAPDRAREEG